ncbi:MAG: TCP-1/cpn60 chaperonin family protein [Candidatus Bathyarchaeia archaeon]
MKLDSTRMPLAHERIPLPDIYVDGQPVLIFDRGTVRRSGEEALRDNIEAARWVMEFVKPLFGPYRLNKLITVREGRSTLTYLSSDLRTIFKKVKVKHPLARFLTGAGIAVSREKGDGAVSTILLAGKILEKCRGLLDLRMHPSAILDGVISAYKKVLELSDRLTVNGLSREQTVRLGIRSALLGKLPMDEVDHFTDLLYRAVQLLGVENLTREGSSLVDFKKAPGGSLSESHLVEGLTLTMEIPHMDMPRIVEGAHIAAIRGELRIPNKKLTRYMDYSFSFEDPGEVERFEGLKKSFLTELAHRVIDAGANVVMVEKGIDDFLLEYFAERDVLAVRGIPPPEFDRIAKAVGARITTHLDRTSREDLGYAERIFEKKLGRQRLLYVTGCRNPGTLDIVLRGSPKHLLDDVERVVRGALATVKAVAEDPRMVWGGGAFEEQVALHLRRYASQLPGKIQIVIGAVAEAFEAIPAMLGENIGLREVDVAAELRSMHARNRIAMGVDQNRRGIADMSESFILDPLAVKLQTIKSAFEAAVTILRIDEYIISRELPEPERHYVERIKKKEKQVPGEEE